MNLSVSCPAEFDALDEQIGLLEVVEGQCCASTLQKALSLADLNIMPSFKASQEAVVKA